MSQTTPDPTSIGERRRTVDFESHSVQKFFLLLDAMESPATHTFIYLGMALQFFQICSFLFNPTFPWGSIIQLVSILLNTTILPFWNHQYVAFLGFDLQVLFLVLLLLSLCLLFTLLLITYHFIDVRSKIRFHMLIRFLLYLLIGPLFIPSVMFIVSLTVCPLERSRSNNVFVEDYDKEICFGHPGGPMTVMCAMGLVALVLLLIPKIIVTMCVYDEIPLSQGIYARSHSIVEGWFIVYIVLFAALSQHLTVRGQEMAFAILFMVANFGMAALHVFYIPFYNDLTNRLRTIGFFFLGYSGLLLTIEIGLGSSFVLYGDNNTEIAFLLPGGVVMGVLAYVATQFRVSALHRRDIARARHGEIHPDKFKRRMHFPKYLPMNESRWFHVNHYVMDPRHSVVVLGGDEGFGQSFDKSSTTYTTFSAVNTSWQHVHRKIEEMEKFEMTCYIDAVYCSTDVELATRFLIDFSRVTNTEIPDHLMQFAIGIYNKGLNRFVRDPWLELQFAVFLCCYIGRTNHVSAALCEALQHRQLDPIVSYRVHRTSSRIHDQRVRQAQAARQFMDQAVRVHKEMLIQMQLFWKRMANEQIDASSLGDTARTIIDGCANGLQLYQSAQGFKVDTYMLSRYAQFLEDVALAPEQAAYARGMAADLAIKVERGGVAEDLQDDKILCVEQKLDKRFGRLSRNLRIFLIVMTVILTGLLVALLVLSILAYLHGVRLLSTIYTIIRFRYYALKTMWLVRGVQGEPLTSPVWAIIEEDLTTLRNLFSDLTYGKYKQPGSMENNPLVKASYNILYDRNVFPLEYAGFWRAGEVFLDAMESLVLYRSGSFTRFSANKLVQLNDLEGLMDVFNNTAIYFEKQSDELFLNTAYVSIAVFVTLIVLLSVMFFIFRYYLSRVTGLSLITLSLFRLIPRNSLESMGNLLSHKIAHFEDPDPEVLQLINERREAGYLGAERIDYKSSERKESASFLMPTLAPMAPADVPAAANSLGGNSGAGPAPLAAVGGVIAMGPLPSRASTSEPVSNPTARQRAFSDDAGASKFDLLARNSSVADVGRIKIHQGQFEAPYQKGFFSLRSFTEDELQERQNQINEFELQQSLAKVRKEKEALREQGHSDHVEEGGNYYAAVTIDASKSTWMRSISIFFSSTIILLATTLALLTIWLLSFSTSRDVGSVMSMKLINSHEVQMYSYISSLEAFIYLAASNEGLEMTPENEAICQEALNTAVELAGEYADSIVKFTEDQNTERETLFDQAMEQHNYFTKTIIDQLLGAGRIVCSSLIPPVGQKGISCSFFASADYDAELYTLNQTEVVPFDSSLELPTSWAFDEALPPDFKAQMAVNVMLSPYYSYLYENTALSLTLLRESIYGYFGSDVSAASKELKHYHLASFLVSVALIGFAFGAVIQMYQYGTTSLAFIFCVFTVLLAGGTLGCQIYLFDSPLVLDGSLSQARASLVNSGKIIRSLYGMLEDAEQTAFAQNWGGIVKFSYQSSSELFDGWNNIFMILGTLYRDEITAAYRSLQTNYYLLTITMRLAVSYLPGMPVQFEELPLIAECKWDLARQTDAQRLLALYRGTSQVMYTDTVNDLSLVEARRIDLARSLTFGPWRATEFAKGRDSLSLIVSLFVDSQIDLIQDREKNQKPLLFTSLVASFFVILLNVISTLYLAIHLVEARFAKRTYRGSTMNWGKLDKGFLRIFRRSILQLTLFSIFVASSIALILVYCFSTTNYFRNINVLNLRELNVLFSDISLKKGVELPWYNSVMQYFAESALASSEEYYRSVKLHFFDDVTPFFFGGVHNVSFIRYNKEIAESTNLTPFVEQSGILAFEDYVHPSMVNWQQRLLEVATLSDSFREERNDAFRDPLMKLTGISFNSTTIVYNNEKERAAVWFALHITFIILTMISFGVMQWYLLCPAVNRLRQEEEGTQVVLQMIPKSMRQAIPAINHYMTTGRITQDTNADEIDQISKDLSVVPIITITSAGKIRQFSRAAEETFLWTRSEAIGQNVRILMPDNVAEHHDTYLQNYLKSGVKYMVGNARVIRAKRKDGSFFNATIEVSEFHTGSELLFVGAFHFSEEAMDLQRSSELSKALTDASTVPIVVCDEDGVIQSFNKSAEVAFKAKSEELVGQKVNMLMPRADAEMHDFYMQRYVRTRISTLLNRTRLFRGKRMNGELFPIRLIIREFQLSSRLLFVGYIEDLTQRFRVEMIASAGEVMKEESPVPLLITDMEANVIQCSKSLRAACGIDAKDILYHDLRTLIKDESAFELIDRVKNNPRGFQIQTDEVHRVECGVRRILEEGSESTFQARITTRIFQWHTKGPHLMVFIEDLTNIQMLDLNCRIGSAVMALSAIPIVVVRENGSIVQMSNSAEQAFRCFAGDVYDKNVDILFDSGDGEPVARPGRVTVRRHPGDDASAEDMVPRGGAGSKNPIAQVLDEYRKTGAMTLCGRTLRGTGRTVDFSMTFPVDVTVKSVEQGEERLFLAYIRNCEEDLRLLEVTKWNNAYMSISPIPVVCADLQGVIFACSELVCERFGWKREELIGSNVSVLMPPRFGLDHDQHVRHFREMLSGVKESERRNLLQRQILSVGFAKTGEEFPVTVNLRDVHQEGAESFIVATLRPSQQDLDLEGLGKVSTTMSLLIPLPYVAINANGIVTEFSRAAQETFGYNEHEIIGQNIKLLQTPDVAANHDGYLRAYVKTGIKHVIDSTSSFVGKKKDGSLLNIELTIKEIRSEKSLEFVGYLRDVTSKKTLKQIVSMDEMAELEARSPVLELDGHGKILQCNFLEADFGYDQHALMGESVLKILPEAEGDVTPEGTATWIQAVMKDLLAQRSHRDASHTFSLRGVKVSVPWVSTRRFARHRSGREVWCEVVVGEVTPAQEENMGPVGSRIKGSRLAQKTAPEATIRDEDARFIVYFMNLQRDVQLALAHGTNRVLVDMFPSPLLKISDRGTIQTFNRAAEEVFGCLASEALGKPAKSLFMPNDIARFESALNEIQAVNLVDGDEEGETPEKTIPSILVRRKGNSGPLAMRVMLSQLLNEQKKPFTLCTLRDMTVEGAEGVEEALSDALVGHSPVPLIVTDHRGVIEEFSEGCESLLGYTKLELVGKNVGTIAAHPSSLNNATPTKTRPAQDFLRSSMTFSQKTLLPVSINEKLVLSKKDGVDVEVHARICSIMPYKLKVPRFVAYFQEIIASKEEELIEERLGALYAVSLSGVLVVASHGVVLSGNRSAQMTLGFDEEGLKNLPISTILPGDTRSVTKLLRAISSTMGTTKESGYESVTSIPVTGAEMVCKDGSRIEVDAVVASVLPSSGRELMRVVVNFMDVTSDRRALICEGRANFSEKVSGYMALEVDVNGNFMRVNEAFLDKLRYDASEIIGLSWTTFVPKGDQTLKLLLEEMLKASKQGLLGTAVKVCVTFVAKNGKSVRMEGEAKGVMLSSGSLGSVIAMLKPMQLPDSLKLQLVLSALNISDAALMLCTVDGAILCANNRTYEIFEIPPDVSIMGQRLISFFPPKLRHDTVGRIQRLLVDGSTGIVGAQKYQGNDDTGSPSHRKNVQNSGASQKFVVEVRVVMVRGEESTSTALSMEPLALSRVSRQSSIHTAHTSQSSRTSGNVYEQLHDEGQSSHLLIRIRPVFERHQQLLLRSGMEKALMIGSYASFTMNEEGVITGWSHSAHQLLGTPSPLGCNACDVVFESASGQKLNQLLKQFTKTRMLFELHRVILRAHYYPPVHQEKEGEDERAMFSPTKKPSVPSAPVSVIAVELQCREARSEHGTLVNNELLCYMRKAPKGSAKSGAEE